MINNNKKLTGRQMRMQHFKELHSKSGLNLVSLMDIFTILVFFLLVNSNAQQLPNSRDVKLPVSVASKIPQENLVIVITVNNILVAGRKIANVQDVLKSPDSVIPSLADALQYQSSRILFSKEDKKLKQHSVTIMGDESTPYGLMSKILATCRHANYTKIAFAAIQKVKSKS